MPDRANPKLKSALGLNIRSDLRYVIQLWPLLKPCRIKVGMEGDAHVLLRLKLVLKVFEKIVLVLVSAAHETARKKRLTID